METHFFMNDKAEVNKYMMWFGCGFMVMGPFFLVLIAIAIYLAVTLSSRCTQHSHYQKSSYHNERAVEILKERYAKGEISKEQFLQMQKELES